MNVALGTFCLAIGYALIYSAIRGGPFVRKPWLGFAGDAQASSALSSYQPSSPWANAEAWV